jgi:hypothetical protein
MRTPRLRLCTSYDSAALQRAEASAGAGADGDDDGDADAKQR